MSGESTAGPSPGWEHWEGSCACGLVRYRAVGPLSEMIHCHCSDCRKRHGAAFATHVGVSKDRFTILQGHEAIRVYVTGADVQRSFCSVCGSNIASDSPSWDEVYFTAGTLDTPLAGLRQLHIFVRSKAAWFDILDSSPQHATYPVSWAK